MASKKKFGKVRRVGIEKALCSGHDDWILRIPYHDGIADCAATRDNQLTKALYCFCEMIQIHQLD